MLTCGDQAEGGEVVVRAVTSVAGLTGCARVAPNGCVVGQKENIVGQIVRSDRVVAQLAKGRIGRRTGGWIGALAQSQVWSGHIAGAGGGYGSRTRNGCAADRIVSAESQRAGADRAIRSNGRSDVQIGRLAASESHARKQRGQTEEIRISLHNIYFTLPFVSATLGGGAAVQLRLSSPLE